MNQFKTIYRLIRFPNLVIIAFTLIIVRYLVIIPGLYAAGINPGISTIGFMLIVINSMLIAAGGYVLNDCFDVDIDLINRPNRQVIGNIVPRRQGMMIATGLLTIALLMGMCISFLLGSVIPAVVFLTAILVVWWYASVLKKTLFWGNLAVACMTAGTIGMAWLFEYDAAALFTTYHASLRLITLLIVIIMIFAGGLNIAREIVKDTVDMEGDSRHYCRSLPLVAGITVVKRVVIAVAVSIILLLFLCMIWLLKSRMYYVSITLAVIVMLPLIRFIALIVNANTGQDFQRSGSLIRWIMVAGLLSIVILNLECRYLNCF